MLSLKGYYLLAEPDLMDPNFCQSIVLIVQHDAQGALGVILNRPINTTVRAAWEKLTESYCLHDGYLHLGGPCEGPMIVIHQNPSLGEIEIIPPKLNGTGGLFFTTNSEQITRLMNMEEGPMKCIVGYAGWTAGQLESELAAEGWIVGPATPEGTLNTPTEAWKIWLKQFSDAMRYPDMKPQLLPPDPTSN